MNKDFLIDYYRMTGDRWSALKGVKNILVNPGLRYLFYSRNADNNRFYKFISLPLQRKYGLEFRTKNIGKGLYIGHPRSIVINKQATIGNNCNINQGVTIGR